MQLGEVTRDDGGVLGHLGCERAEIGATVTSQAHDDFDARRIAECLEEAVVEEDAEVGCGAAARLGRGAEIIAIGHARTLAQICKYVNPAFRQPALAAPPANGAAGFDMRRRIGLDAVQVIKGIRDRMGHFDGQVVWITGGGSGIGRALAMEFAHQGADVAVSGRRSERLEEVVAGLRGLGRRAFAVACDVGDDANVGAAVASVIAQLGRLDVAVANAGFSVMGRLEKLSEAEWQHQIDTNVLGVVRTIRHALPELRKTRGRMVLIGSVSGQLCIPSSSAYSASKFAVRAIGLTLAQELSGSGVTCTTIHPGFVESEISKVDNQGRFHDDRKDMRPQALMWTAQRAAKSMMWAIRKRKREYVFTVHGKIGAWLGRHASGFIHLAMTRGRK